MAGAQTGRSIQIWRLSDLSLLQTMMLPPGPRGDENENPSEVRVLDDGNTVIVGTFKCGMYLVENVATEPVVSFLRSFPWAPAGDDDTDCNLPIRVGKFWVQTIGTTGSLVVLNLENPRKPEIVSEFSFGVDARPHWLSLEPNGNRIVMTGGGTLRGGVVLMEIDTVSGRLSLVESFRSPRHPFGLSFYRDEWPHGSTGPAYAHGAVFRKMPASTLPTKPATGKQANISAICRACGFSFGTALKTDAGRPVGRAKSEDLIKQRAAAHGRLPLLHLGHSSLIQ
jgi:hypothetical protein